MRLLALSRLLGRKQPAPLPDVELVDGLKREAAVFGPKPYPRPEVDGERSIHRMTPIQRKTYLRLVCK